MATYAEQLEEVQAAITAIITGSQAYSVSGRSVSKADLATLQQREKWLIRMVAGAAIPIRGVTIVD